MTCFQIMHLQGKTVHNQEVGIVQNLEAAPNLTYLPTNQLPTNKHTHTSTHALTVHSRISAEA